MSSRGTSFGMSARSRKGLVFFWIALFVWSLVVSSAGAIAPATVLAANPSADLDQCANDPAPSPHTDGCNTSATQWVNGNLGASKSIYFEGDSIPYRMKFDNLPLSSHTVIIEWDTTKSSKHAIDYITTWNRTVADSDPCLGVSGCSASTTFPIPADPQVTGAGVTQAAGHFTFFGGTITSVSAYSYSNGAGFTGDKSASIAVTFTPTVANPVLAWGGHIATRADWGNNNSAVAISGSPYHTRLISLDGVGGNQDRSLSADAVIFPGSIKIIKDAQPNSSTSFPFTASPAPLSNFSLVDDGTSSNTKLFSGITNFQTYTVTEGSVQNWVLDNVDCSVTSPNGGSQTVAGAKVTIDLAEGENVTCTYTNVSQPAEVHVTKTADDTSVSAGSQIGFTVTLSNTGTGTATGVAFSDPLPGGSGINWSISPASAGWSISGSAPNQSLVYTPTTLAPGFSTSVHVVSNTTSASCGTYDNTASVTTGNDGSDEASASTEVKCAVIDLTKVADAASVSAGDTIGFVITATNTGTGTATNVTVTDVLPTQAGLSWTIDAANSDTGCSISAGTLTCNFGSLAPNASKHVHIVSGTTKASCATIDNTANVTTGNDGSDQASASTQVLCGDVSITKVADQGSVSAGDTIGFVITVKNNGTGNATTVTVTDTLPTQAGLSWSIDGANSDAGCSISGGVLTCNFGTLTPGQSKHVHITSPTTKDSCATIDNTANVTTGNDGSGQASDSVVVNCAAIDVNKVADAASVSAGDQIGFTVTLSNTGAGTATGLSFTDPLPTGGGALSWSISPASAGWSISNGNLVFSPTTLAAGASTSVHVIATTTKADCGTIDNTATVTTSNDGSDTASASVDVNCADIHLLKVADAGSVSAGDTIGFVITVTNSGAGEARGVTVTDVLPTQAGLNWSIDAANSDSGCSISGGTLTCNFGTLAAGASRHVHITSPTTSASCATINNTATVTTSNDGSAQASDSVVVNCPTLEVVKVADAGTVNAGDPIGFSIVVTNTGLGTAKSVTLNDPLPAGVTWTIDGGTNAGDCQIAANTLTCSFGDLAPGGMADVHISAQTSAEACTTYDNTATASATNADDAEGSDSIVCLTANIEIEKVADAHTVDAGDTIGFTVTVTNSGAGTAKGVTVNDPLPTDAGLDWTLDNDASGKCSIVSGSVVCGPLDLAAGASFSFHISSGTTAATAVDSPVDNEACVTTTNDGEGCANDKVDVLGADIQISKVADDNSVDAGDTIGFTVVVKNNGAGAAKGVTVSDPLPTDAGLDWTLDDNAGGKCSLASGVVTCGPLDLAAGASFTFHITSDTTAATVADSPVENEACVTTSNDGQDCASDEIVVLGANIQIEKTADADGVEAGQTIGFTVTVSNTGSGGAKGVIVKDTLPTDAGLAWTLDDNAGGKCSLASGVVTCGPLDLAAGASFTFHVSSTTTAATAATSPVTNEACVETSNDGKDCSEADVDVFVLTIDKTNNAPLEELELPDHTTAELPTADEGATVTYTLSYHVGSSAVTNGTITDVIPAGLDYVDGTASSNAEFTFVAYDQATRTLSWTAATVTTDGTLTYQVKVAKGAGNLAQPLENVATIDSDQTTPDKDTSDVFVPVPPLAETAPPTDVLASPQGQSAPGSSLLLTLMVLGGVVLVIGFVTPVPAAIRRRKDR